MHIVGANFRHMIGLNFRHISIFELAHGIGLNFRHMVDVKDGHLVCLKKHSNNYLCEKWYMLL